jgi:putative transposase
MIVFEFKAKGTKQQYQKIDEAIRITQFIRNKCLRFWKDNQNVKPSGGRKLITLVER